MIAFCLALVAFVVGYISGRLYRSDAQHDAAFWERKATEHFDGWLAADKRVAELERELDVARNAGVSQR